MEKWRTSRSWNIRDIQDIQPLACITQSHGHNIPRDPPNGCAHGMSDTLTMAATSQLVLAMLQTLQAELPPDSLLTFSSLFRFINLASTLRNDILLIQGASHPPNIAPEFISPTINLFLAACCDLCESDVDVYWKVLKDVVWHSGDMFSVKDMSALFANHGQ